MNRNILAAVTGSAFLLAATLVQAEFHPAAEAQVLELAKQAIALRSVRGEGNQTPAVAELFKKALLEGGWPEDTIEIVSYEDTAYLIATWPGTDPSLSPIVVSAHMDVVEAKSEDWERDPFTPVVENGYLFGRGASDTKFEAALALVSMIELRREGYTPTRSLVLAYSGDEETTMKTSKIIAERLRDARLVLNVDGASGTFNEETGEPLYWSWQGAEKTYVDFHLEVTNPGGHSSAPRPENAIQQMSQALARIAAYRFEPEQNDITREYFAKAAAVETDPELAAAMQAFAADPTDAKAIEVLRADPATIGAIGTTCVPTIVNGGHAINALPQRVTANVNCRIFPGHSREEIMAELERVAGVPEVKFSDATGDESLEAPPSPPDPLLIAAVTKAVGVSWGDEVLIFPSQSAGASDSMWYRAVGVPSYGASASMMKHSDEFAHGLNERISVSNIAPGVKYYLSVFRDLTSQ